MGVLASETTCKGVSFSAFPASRIKMGTVEVLLSRRSPATIASAIRAVIVDSIKRFSQRPLTHICQEVHKRTPAFVNGDTSSPVEIIIRGLRVGAAHPHGIPTVIGARLKSIEVCMAMLPLALSTPTRFALATFQVACNYGLHVATIALAFPHRLMEPVDANMPKGNEPTKSLSRQICSYSHRNILPQKGYSFIYLRGAK